MPDTPIYCTANAVKSLEGQYGKRGWNFHVVKTGDTLDIGGDKDLPALALPKEDNPFLGFRAIRLCLQRKDLFRVQLRALLRASVYGNLHIMFPMISSLEELREAKAMLAQAREELLAEGVCVAPVKVGIMIEI
ncbi:MAG: hypothetical protein KHW59_05335, partial [Clostridiales bacterium]|nr:hypothetical protein [Clostridiales bacterium]